MLCALVAMYTVTERWIGSALVVSTLDVRQGSPTSCMLFIIYVNELIRTVKEGNGNDGFLKWLQIFVLMDGTVLLFTSREGMMLELSHHNSFCSEYGMDTNESKAIFLLMAVIMTSNLW